MTRFRPCHCEAMSVARLPRSTWVRILLPRLRSWVCTSCGTRFLASKAAMVGVRKDDGQAVTSR